jgi:hypothetical protein
VFDPERWGGGDLENKGIWRIQEFGEYRNLENKGIWRIKEFRENERRPYGIKPYYVVLYMTRIIT